MESLWTYTYPHSFTLCIAEKTKVGQAEKQLWSVIAHYLHKHNELCLAGMGRFACTVNECRVDPVAKLMFPAGKTVFFQSGDFATTPDFSLFLKTVLGKTDLDVDDKLLQFASLFRAGLKEKGKFEVEGFGSFRTNVMGEPEFEQHSSVSFRDESYGLKPVHFAANLVKTKRITIDKEEEDPELTEMRESALKELKVMLDQARVAEASKEKKSSLLFPVVATVLILILLANIGFFLYKGPVDDLKTQVSKMNLLGKTEELIDSQHAVSTEVPAATPAEEVKEPVVAKADSIAMHLGNVYQTSFYCFDSSAYQQPVVVSAPVETPAPAEIPVVEPLSVQPEAAPIEKATVAESDLPNMVNVDAAENAIDKGFYVIAGAFREVSNAKRMVDKLQSKGDSGALMFKPNSHPYYLVAYSRGNTLNQALTLLENKEKQHPSVWVYCAY